MADGIIKHGVRTIASIRGTIILGSNDNGEGFAMMAHSGQFDLFRRMALMHENLRLFVSLPNDDMIGASVQDLIHSQHVNGGYVRVDAEDTFFLDQ